MLVRMTEPIAMVAQIIKATTCALFMSDHLGLNYLVPTLLKDIFFMI